jgi:Protein of unknown function (DUF2845)
MITARRAAVGNHVEPQGLPRYSLGAGDRPVRLREGYMSRLVFQFKEPRRAVRLALAAACFAALPAAAQSLSCGGSLVEVGDDKPALVKKCGNPVHVETVCVPRPSLRGWTLDASGQPAQPLVVLECAPVEDWTFDRGAGTFSSIVRLRDARIESIRDGEKLP